MPMTVLFVVGELQFEWDAEKARTNVRKHGLRFEESATVFKDRMALLLEDPQAF